MASSLSLPLGLRMKSNRLQASIMDILPKEQTLRPIQRTAKEGRAILRVRARLLVPRIILVELVIQLRRRLSSREQTKVPMTSLWSSRQARRTRLKPQKAKPHQLSRVLQKNHNRKTKKHCQRQLEQITPRKSRRSSSQMQSWSSFLPKSLKNRLLKNSQDQRPPRRNHRL